MTLRLGLWNSGPVLHSDRIAGRATALVVAGIWLVYLAEPMRKAWSQHNTVKGVVGLASMAGFAVVYLVHFHSWRASAIADNAEAVGDVRSALAAVDPSARPAVPRAAVTRYVLLGSLALTASVTTGESALATWVFLAVAGVFTFRLPIAVAVGLAIAVGLLAATRVVPGWTFDSSASLSTVLALVAVGAGVSASRRSRQVTAMRAENARLELAQERNRVARDLHDILGHSLSVVTLKADLAGRLIDSEPERAREELADIQRLSRDALADVRSTIAGLNTLSLPTELARARAALAAAEVEADVPRHTEDVPSDRRELFAWAVREAVTNVVRHSRASRCTITLGPREVRIVDDGQGCPDLDRRPGSGLRGLRERAAMSGARVVTESLQPHGFSLAVMMGEAP